MGNAWGEHVTYQLAGTSPQRLASLAAISAPPLALPEAERRRIRVLSYVVWALGPLPVLRTMIAEAQLTAAVAHINRAVRGVSRRSLANTLRSFTVGRTDLDAMAAAGTMPMLFLASDDRGDMTPADAQTMADQCADATVQVISGAPDPGPAGATSRRGGAHPAVLEPLLVATRGSSHTETDHESRGT